MITEHISEKELAIKFELNSTKELIYNVLFLPIKDFLIHNLDTLWNGVSEVDLLQGFDIKKQPTKADLIKICARFYSNVNVMTNFYEWLPSHDKKIIEESTWTGNLNYKALEKIFGEPVIVINERLGISSSYRKFYLEFSPKLKRWEKLIQFNGHWNDYSKNEKEYLKSQNPTIIFPFFLRQLYSIVLPKPKGYYYTAIEQPENTIVFNAEETIFREMPLITAYYLQGNIRYTKKGIPNAASVRKMAKTIQLKPSPGEGENALRAMLIAGLFSDNFKMSAISETPLNIIKQLFAQNFKKYPPVFFMLQHLKGINYLQYYDFNNSVTELIFNELFRTLPTKAWVSFDNIKDFANAHFFNINPIDSFWLLQRLSTELGAKKYYEIQMDTSNAKDYIVYPYLAGHIYLLAAFGLMEIAVDETVENKYSFYDGLKAIRLTALGSYILGVQPDYNQPKNDNETKLTFDENSTIIRVEGHIALADTMMNNYATKMSENRYQFSPEKFLKDCKSTKNLENKVSLFKQTVGQKLPDFWENYLEQLISNSKIIEQYTKLKVFKLPSDNKELHRIIAQDEELKKIIIKAEKFHVLVEENNHNIFINRMKVLGYLVN